MDFAKWEGMSIRQEAHEAAQLAEKAAAHLEEHGWMTGWGSQDEATCIMGAINAIANGGDPRPSYDSGLKATGVWRRLVGVLAKVVGQRNTVRKPSDEVAMNLESDLIGWNDDSAQPGDAVRVLRSAAVDLYGLSD